MRRILASTFVLALFAVAFAGPPIDYELKCGDDLIGVLSLTEGKVHVALVEGASCAAGTIVVEGPDDAPAVFVEVEDWQAEPLAVNVTIGVDDDAVEADDVDLVMVPQVAIDGMLNAQRLRTAAMEMRREAAERGETDRDRSAWDDAEGDDPPAGPPADAPRGDGAGGSPADAPCDDAPAGPPADASCDDGTGDGPGGPPDDAPRGDGTGEGTGRRP